MQNQFSSYTNSHMQGLWLGKQQLRAGLKSREQSWWYCKARLPVYWWRELTDLILKSFETRW